MGCSVVGVCGGRNVGAVLAAGAEAAVAYDGEQDVVEALQVTGRGASKGQSGRTYMHRNEIEAFIWVFLGQLHDCTLYIKFILV